MALAIGGGVSPTYAQGTQLVWDLDRSGAAPVLRYHIPSVRYVQLKATCAVPGTANVLLGADTGLRNDGDPVSVQFFGAGQNLSVPATVSATGADENVFGVSAQLPVDHPLWNALATSPTLDYRVENFVAGRFDLGSGADAVNGFTAACAGPAAAPAPTAAAPQPSTSGFGEREAFEYARQLDSAAAYEAFIATYPQGFFAQMARAMLAQKQGAGTAVARVAPAQPAAPTQPAAPQAPAAPKLEPYRSDAGTTPWTTGDYEFEGTDAKAFAARVEGKGVEFVTYCDADKKLQALVRRKGDGYPKFAERMNQSILENPKFTFTFPGGSVYEFPVAVYSADTEFGIAQGFDGDAAFYRDLIKDRSFNVLGSTLGAEFQLKKSKDAICEVINQCGISSPECGGAAPARAATASTRSSGPKRVQCRSRSTFVEGRGCVLNRYLNSSKRRSGSRRTSRDKRCKARSVFVAGKGCVRRRSVGKI